MHKKQTASHPMPNEKPSVFGIYACVSVTDMRLIGYARMESM